MAFAGKVLSFDHNWATGGLLERLSWFTSVHRHRDATEQRSQKRQDPRRQFELSLLAQTPQLRSYLDNWLYSAQDEAVMVPIFTDGQRLASAVAPTATLVPVPTTFYDFDVDQYIVLWRSPLLYEVGQIESMTANDVTLVDPLASGWPAGTRIYPARLGRIEDTARGTQIAHDVRPYTLVVSMDEEAYSTNRFTAISPLQYKNVDIFPTPTEASEDLDFSYIQNWQHIDFQIGVIGIDSGAQDRPNILMPYRQLFRNREEISAWLGFLNRRKGQRVPFWTPTWETDFPATALTTGVLGTVTYSTTGYADLIGVEDGRKDVVFIVLRDCVLHDVGDHVYKRIISVVNLGGGLEQLTLNITDFDAPEFDNFKLSFARYCRLSSDTVELFWETSCIAKTLVAFKEMRNVPA